MDMELLQAIGQLLDEKLEHKLDEKLDEKLGKLEERLEQTLEEKLEHKLEEKLEQQFAVKLQPIYDELDAIRQRMLKIEVTQENIIEKRLKLISEEVLDINEKLDRSLVGRLQLENHEYRIQSLEQTVKAALP